MCLHCMEYESTPCSNQPFLQPTFDRLNQGFACVKPPCRILSVDDASKVGFVGVWSISVGDFANNKVTVFKINHRHHFHAFHSSNSTLVTVQSQLIFAACPPPSNSISSTSIDILQSSQTRSYNPSRDSVESISVIGFLCPQ